MISFAMGFAATLLISVLLLQSLRRSVDDAYQSGWRDGYDLGYVHGVGKQKYQREDHVPRTR